MYFGSKVLCTYQRALCAYFLYKVRSVNDGAVTFSINDAPCYRPQRSWGKVMFLQASVILLTGGSTWHPRTSSRHPPRTWSRHPPRTRYTSPPRTRYTPPGTRYTPQDQVHPPEQVHPPGPGTPPRRRACWEIRSMSGWYASYWNAILSKRFFAPTFSLGIWVSCANFILLHFIRCLVSVLCIYLRFFLHVTFNDWASRFVIASWPWTPLPRW